jgi:DNA-binding winged helix-turn-helix (wHTH) protein
MPASDSISAYGLELFPHERLAFVNGRPVELTAREFDILLRLAAHPRWVYSSEQLSDGEEETSDSSPDSVRVHIAHLRHKLALAEADGVIGTVRGVGYRLQGGGPEDDTIPEPDDAEANSMQTGDDTHDRSRRLRDSFWLLERAVLELEELATDGQIESACDALDDARRAISRLLAEGAPKRAGEYTASNGMRTTS